MPLPPPTKTTTKTTTKAPASTLKIKSYSYPKTIYQGAYKVAVPVGEAERSAVVYLAADFAQTQGFVMIAIQGERRVKAYQLPMLFDRAYGVTADNIAVLGSGGSIYLVNLS